MTNEEHIEEILITSYKKGFSKDVINRASELMKGGTESFLAFEKAYIERNEIYRREHPKQSSFGRDDKERS